MEMNMVGWFEIPVEDMARAKAFYEAIFEKPLEQLPVEGSEMFAFPWFDNAPHAAGALVKHEMYKPSPDGVKIYFTAPDINATLEKINASGGAIIMPETSIGKHGFIAMFKDTEGNILALHRRPDEAPEA